MAHYDFNMPVAEEAVRRLRVNDTVTLNGTLYGMKVGGSHLVVDRRVFDASKHYLWPVPQADIDMNKNLLPNNTGW